MKEKAKEILGISIRLPDYQHDYVIDKMLEFGRLVAEEQRFAILQLENPWCLIDVLKKLSDSADKLLDKYNYDGGDHEEVYICSKRAKEIIEHILNTKNVCDL